jgi:hypothetical protein
VRSVVPTLRSFSAGLATRVRSLSLYVNVVERRGVVAPVS